MSPVIQALLFLPLALAARVRGIERGTIARLNDAGANTADRAIRLERGGRLREFVYYRLNTAGALQITGGNRYYLDQHGYEAFRGRRRKRTLVVLIALLLGLAAGFYRGVFT